MAAPKAAPKAESGALSSQLALSLVGKVVTATLSNGETVAGELQAYDPASNSLALSLPTEAGTSAKHISVLRGAHVRSLAAVEGASVPPRVDGEEALVTTVEAVKKRETKALAKAAEDCRNVNAAVTNQAQNIYNALRKTMPCEWKGNDIVVMELVTIRGPNYMPEGCEGSDEVSLSRVRKVVRAAAHAPM
mmetsp:Transcript_45668/g.105385  ORF Transcript_45668/g.105385 Transcript_45668/m.105385 type:complete len:191 (+) Transcript_45668:999-1571(+)